MDSASVGCIVPFRRKLLSPSSLQWFPENFCSTAYICSVRHLATGSTLALNQQEIIIYFLNIHDEAQSYCLLALVVVLYTCMF
jgi:hypothetical protein